MQDDNIFLQKGYQDENIYKYGCNFLTICKISQGLNPKVKLDSQSDILEFSKECQEQGIIDSEYFVNSSLDLLRLLTGARYIQLTTIERNKGIGSTSEWLPIHYPVPQEAIQIACYRRKDNFKSTHFSQIETISGETFSCTNIFNTLGADWLEKNKENWYASDKRAYLKKE